jgi:hypothetical protein
MKKLLWLDDVRDPFVYDWLLRYAPEWDSDRDNVVWVKSYKEFCTWITENGLPHTIAFDHDLGYQESGMDSAKWLVDWCLDKKETLPKWVVQSANPVGRDNINGLLNGFNKYNNGI